MEKKIFACADRVARTWLNDCENLNQAVMEAMKKGYGFVVQYQETGDKHSPWKLKVVGWKMHLVDFSTAMGMVPADDEFRPFYEDAHRRAPQKKFLAASSPKGPIIFCPGEFDEIDELPLVEYQKLLQSA